MNIEEGKQRGLTSTGPGPGYPFSKAAPAGREPDRLLCWGLGVGWFLLLDEWFIAKDGEELIPKPQVLCTLFWFILGFIFGIIPWYVGAIMLFCVKREHYNREKPGFIACAIFAVIGTILIIIVVATK